MYENNIIIDQTVGFIYIFRQMKFNIAILYI